MKKIKSIFINIYTSILPLLGGILGSIGGADNTSKGWRRILIPLLITQLAYLETESILVSTILFMIIPLSMGYGIPQGTDKGSGLGRFFMKLSQNNHRISDILVRGTIGTLIPLSLISIPIINKNWSIYFIGLMSIILVNALISWRGFGTYRLFKKELSWVETITWGLITLFATLIIKLK